MVELQERLHKVKAEELLQRFRSKVDLYKYMVNQSNPTSPFDITSIVGLYLPSYDGTKISFIKAILSDQKKVLK